MFFEKLFGNKDNSTKVNKKGITQVVATVTGIQPVISFVNGKQITEGVIHLYKISGKDNIYTDSRTYPQQVYEIGEEVTVKININSNETKIIE